LSLLNRWMLLVLVCIPLSCSAQNNVLKRISSAKRSDGKGYVLRFHLIHKVSSFDFSQPRPRVVELEMHGANIDTSKIHLYDRHNVIQNVKYYSLKNGIGIDLFLKKGTLYKARAYPDRASKDMLIGLTKTTQKKLIHYITSMKPFAWSNIPNIQSASGQEARAVDTTYQKLKQRTKFDTVVLDPGHGGHDTGAIGWHHTYEKNIVLAIAKKVGHYIHKYMPSVTVDYTRKTDKFVSLKQRGRIANRDNGDLFVSIHANAAPHSKRAHGTEVYFLGLERSHTALKVMERENNIVSLKKAGPDRKISKQQLMIYELANSGYIDNSQKLAEMVHHQFKARADRKARGVKQARFVVLYHASMPAILIETGFITDPKECKFLRSNYGQSIIASAIFRAIRNYKEQFDKSQHFNASNQ